MAATLDFTPDSQGLDFTPGRPAVNFPPDPPIAFTPDKSPFNDATAQGNKARLQDAMNQRMTADPGAFTAALSHAPSDILEGVGHGARNLVGAGTLMDVGDPEDAWKQLKGETNEQGQTPIEEGIGRLSPVPRALASGSYGLVESAPKIAAVA